MTVIDASALAAIVLREEGWETLLDSSDVFVSVELALKEAANAIWAASLSGSVSPSQAEEAFSVLREMFTGGVVETRPQSELIDGAFRLALRRGITVYDSLYVVLAASEGLPLLTLDGRQAEAARAEGVEVLP